MTRIPINVQPGSDNAATANGGFSASRGEEPAQPAGADTTTETQSETPDPTAPSQDQPVDSRFEPSQFDVRGSNRVMNSAHEIAGPGGADVTGGELTNPQDAEDFIRKSVERQKQDGEMQQRQMEGEVEVQTHDLKPSPAHPAEGMPENPTGKENTGGANESADEANESGNTDTANTASSTRSTDASAGEVSRDVTEADDRFLRAVADLENYKRQSLRREVESRERAVRGVIEDLLPVLDNFERALDAAKNARDVESLRVGVEFIAQQFRDALKNHGVEPIEAQDKMFDPLHHEALEEVGDSGRPEGTVISEAQRGYVFKGQVLRPSRVRVAGK
jgi:molecular chaperone GrpE